MNHNRLGKLDNLIKLQIPNIQLMPLRKRNKVLFLRRIDSWWQDHLPPKNVDAVELNADLPREIELNQYIELGQKTYRYPTYREEP